MARYTYLACDLVTNQVLAELPIVQAKFARVLDEVGDFSGKIKLTDPNVWKVGPLTGSLPGRTALYVDRDGTLVWGGIVWTRKYTSSDGMLEIQGQTFESYFDHRMLTVTAGLGTLWGTGTSSVADELAIVEALVNWLQGVGGGNIGINVPSNTAGVSVAASWQSYELKVIGEIIRELSQADNGFDWAVDVAYDSSGIPTKTLRLSYPRRGATFTQSGWVFEFEASGGPDGTGLSASGNISEYEWPEDATLQGITVHELGAGFGTTMPISSYTTQAMIDGGYPLLEQAFTHKDVTDPNRLSALAISEGKAAASPIALPVLHVRPDMDPVLGSYSIGDDARIRILDFRFNNGLDAVNNPIAPGLDQYWRIVRMDVQPGFDQVEQVTLTLGIPPA